MTGSTSTGRHLDDLRSQVAGPVHGRGEAGALVELGELDTEVHPSPVAVVGVRDAADVASAVRWAARRGLAVGVHATGRGDRYDRDVVVVSTRRLTTCTVDLHARTATVGAGVRWRTVIEAAAAAGLAPLTGSSPTVGVVGDTLGGGIGALARQYGFAADHVRSLELVTADGATVEVTPESRPDLYWAVLGAPGSFGVVTRLELDLVPVRRLYGGALYFGLDQAAAVLDAFRAWTTDVPDATTASVALLAGPGVCALPTPTTHRGLVQLRFAHVGDSETGSQVLAPLRACSGLVADTVREMPYAAVAGLFREPATAAPAHRTGVFLDALDADAVSTLLRALASRPRPPLAMVELRHLGAALGRLPVRPNCVGGRDADFLLGLVAHRLPQPAGVRQGFCRDVLEAMAPWTAGVVPIDYLRRSCPPVSPWLPEDHARLRQIKRRHDPGNTFRVGPTVQP